MGDIPKIITDRNIRSTSMHPAFSEIPACSILILSPTSHHNLFVKHARKPKTG